ncbi:tryptophan 7-halogenase [Erythrobacter sp. THAF29]|uniref:tryptophan 7-halogenase n=1 Tax=Erythrobacter sp. THAF29 TaxID=2587851 RepID=UPI0012692000|nr:tryptophan 7-halogenase [Erythrobacter sp. THAF29]QFT78716.1 Flavin-dependent tryptophan halogenase RebH [Erythrobacter sp. THAF29]
MSDARELLRRIVVAGSGEVGAICAIALKRALPSCDVTVLELPVHLNAFADRANTALPFTNKLHDRLGISEEKIVRHAGGSHRLVTRYFGWSGRDSYGVASYGAEVDPTLKTRFAQDWGGGSRSAGADIPAVSIAEALADAGRFAIPPDDRDTPLSQLDYALRWNGPSYRQLLVGHARKLGVGHLQDSILAIEPDTLGGIAALKVEGHGRLEADLFVDCSGPDALLLSSLPDYAIEDWSDVLPVRRIIEAAPGQPMLVLEDRVTLLPEGWLFEIAGRDGLRTMIGTGAGKSREQAINALGAPPAIEHDLAPSRCRKPWLGNVIAIGDASARLEPLGSLSLDLAHRQISLLLEMLPGRSIEPLERAEYNRRAILMADGAKDVLAMHYAAPRAHDVFKSKIPLSVERTIDQFTRKGRLPFQEEFPLLTEEVMILLVALGFTAGTPPQHRNTDARELEARGAKAAAKARAAVEFAPPYTQWMEHALGRTA